jgi:hypothetical protein
MINKLTPSFLLSLFSFPFLVRDYVINQHSEDELRALQKAVVEAVLAARPEPGGFPLVADAGFATFTGYVGRQLYVHLRGALEVGEEPPDAWLAHQDDVIKANVANAVGMDGLTELLESRESAGELVRAAYCARGMSLSKGISPVTIADHLFRAQELLERADEKEAIEYELSVLNACWIIDFGSERSQKANWRKSALMENNDTNKADALVAEAQAIYSGACVKIGLFGDMALRDQATVDAGIRELPVCARKWSEAGRAPDIHKNLKTWTDMYSTCVSPRHRIIPTYIYDSLSFKRVKSHVASYRFSEFLLPHVLRIYLSIIPLSLKYPKHNW